MNKKRVDSINYPCGNLMMLQNKTSNLRYYYSGIASNSYDEHISDYMQGEFIGLAGNDNANNKDTLHVELEDIEKHQLLNPAPYFNVSDTKSPVINDLFFIDIHNREISLFQTKKVIRGGKLFIKCCDYIDDNPEYEQLLLKEEKLINALADAQSRLYKRRRFSNKLNALVELIDRKTTEELK